MRKIEITISGGSGERVLEKHGRVIRAFGSTDGIVVSSNTVV